MISTGAIVRTKHLLLQSSRSMADRVAAVLMLALLAPLMSLIVLTLLISSKERRAIKRELCVGRDGSPFLLLKFRPPLPEDDPWTAAFLRMLGRLELLGLPNLINAARGEVKSFGAPPKPWPPTAPEGNRQRLADPLVGLWR